MPGLTNRQRVQVIKNALTESNALAVLTSNPRQNPRQFTVSSAQGVFDLWVYIWTLTHGGGNARPTNEYRIQITGIQSPLRRNPNGPTLMVGYEPNLGCFAGFDIIKHSTFSSRSPSIQIPITTLNEALQNGFSFTVKGNEEIAIGIRNDQFLAYCLNAPMLHNQGSDPDTVELLQRAVSLKELNEIDYQSISPERRAIVKKVTTLSRASNFRKKVTNAYDRRCAVTRMQLNLIDAAHILPVGVRGSNDEVANGICLSPTYHRAYDTSLIYLDENYIMQINPTKLSRLGDDNVVGGLDRFSQNLGERIYLPTDANQWPSIDFIREANRIREIS